MIVLRILAMLVAIGGIVDPALRLTRTEPLPGRVFTAPDDPDAAAAASTLRTALSGRADLVDVGSGAATVVIGRPSTELGTALSLSKGELRTCGHEWRAGVDRATRGAALYCHRRGSERRQLDSRIRGRRSSDPAGLGLMVSGA